MKNSKFKIVGFAAIYCILHFALCIFAIAQEVPPAPGVPKAVTVPAVQEKKLANGLTVAVVQKSQVPLVTINLLIRAGASGEDAAKAGLADMTASMLTKGTKTRTATQIAEAIEFLGGSISSGAGWNASYISVTVTSDKVAQAMAILADVVLNPKFDQKEIDLLRSQSLDGLTYSLKQPSFLANYVASKYSFKEHPVGGTPASIGLISRADILKFQKDNYNPANSVLVFAGDISAATSSALAAKYFSTWRNPKHTVKEMRLDRITKLGSSDTSGPRPVVNRFLVIDLPNSGQASVVYAQSIPDIGRSDARYFPASVLNSVLGGGYSSRLNQEIRIKRGLSYGAGSSFEWRSWKANFATQTQTKNESAAEVTELVIDELRKLSTTATAESELIPRKSGLTGPFGLSLETTGGLAGEIGELYGFGIPSTELNSYVANINGVTNAQIKDFALGNLLGGDIVIVGDYSIFKADLAKRFPKMTVEVIKADDLDLSKDNLRK
ncbi:MAG TPA: pitrilysin family protein [Pyrinomonadaceae bacterium]|nr:pitrilysin family protein [Pyrinomonadaceae bacterium]